MYLSILYMDPMGSTVSTSDKCQCVCVCVCVCLFVSSFACGYLKERDKIVTQKYGPSLRKALTVDGDVGC